MDPIEAPEALLRLVARAWAKFDFGIIAKDYTPTEDDLRDAQALLDALRSEGLGVKWIMDDQIVEAEMGHPHEGV
jgi:hypothetical protein